MKIYNSIDNLNLYCYGKILETNDLRYLLVLDDYFELPEIKEKEYNELFKIWENINDEIVELTGISEDYKEQFRLRKSIALLKVDMIVNENKSLQTLIEIKEMELLNLQPKNKTSIDESIISIESILKIQINDKKTSTKKYFSYIKFINKKHEEN